MKSRKIKWIIVLFLILMIGILIQMTTMTDPPWKRKITKFNYKIEQRIRKNEN